MIFHISILLLFMIITTIIKEQRIRLSFSFNFNFQMYLLVTMSTIWNVFGMLLLMIKMKRTEMLRSVCVDRILANVGLPADIFSYTFLLLFVVRVSFWILVFPCGTSMKIRYQLIDVAIVKTIYMLSAASAGQYPSSTPLIDDYNYNQMWNYEIQIWLRDDWIQYHAYASDQMQVLIDYVIILLWLNIA